LKALDLPLSPDQEMLRSATSRFAQAEWPMDNVRAGIGATQPSDIAAYACKAGDLGWYAMLVPEEYGGGSVSGLGLSDAAVFATERGRHLQPGPFIGSNVVADALGRGVCDKDLLDVAADLAAGRSLACWTLADATVMTQSGVRSTPDGDGYVLDGVARLVEHGDVARWILVSASSGGGLAHFLLPMSMPGLTLTAIESLDVSRGYQRVYFDRVRVPGSAAIGEPEGSISLAERALQVATVLSVADMVGAMSADLAMAVDYARARIAFGRPIGSFQAVKHLLAETSLLLEQSKAILDAAVAADGTEDACKLASIAKAFVSDCAIDLGQNCFQVFGGVAFTWEHDHHLFMRRMTMEAALYGDPSWHRERICTLYGVEGSVA
jgi:alkylation response protein AidB-like acyl-CoA dehydrogenase